MMRQLAFITLTIVTLSSCADEFVPACDYEPPPDGDYLREFNDPIWDCETGQPHFVMGEDFCSEDEGLILYIFPLSSDGEILQTHVELRDLADRMGASDLFMEDERIRIVEIVITDEDEPEPSCDTMIPREVALTHAFIRSRFTTYGGAGADQPNIALVQSGGDDRGRILLATESSSGVFPDTIFRVELDYVVAVQNWVASH